MKQQHVSALIIIIAMIFSGCSKHASNSDQSWKAGTPVDIHASDETRALLHNLKSLGGRAILFGQQDALCYGVGRNPANGCCDVKDVTGSFPAIYGFDIGHICDSVNVDGVPFGKMIRLIREGYQRGGVITISWHEKNPFTGGNAWDIHPTVQNLLPGGSLHQIWVNRLNKVGQFFSQLKDDKGTPIPVIFRPYHEHNGDWFWWGKGHCTPQEFIGLWRFTVDYLRDSLKLHQLLYAISPDRSRMKSIDEDSSFLYAYPGDEYVDIIGLDNYWDVGRSSDYVLDITRHEQDSLMVGSLRTLVKVAQKHEKLPALSETGQDGLKEADWFTSRLLKPVKGDTLARRIAYILVWRNASVKHCYAPFPGHPAAADFLRFKDDPLIVFEDELPSMYTR